MTTSRRLVALPLMLIGLAALCAALVLVTWVVQAQAQEVTPTRDATGDNPPAKPTNLQASEEHDAVTLWARARPRAASRSGTYRAPAGADHTISGRLPP